MAFGCCCCFFSRIYTVTITTRTLNRYLSGCPKSFECFFLTFLLIIFFYDLGKYTSRDNPVVLLSRILFRIVASVKNVLNQIVIRATVLSATAITACGGHSRKIE